MTAHLTKTTVTERTCGTCPLSQDSHVPLVQNNTHISIPQRFLAFLFLVQRNWCRHIHIISPASKNNPVWCRLMKFTCFMGYEVDMNGGLMAKSVPWSPTPPEAWMLRYYLTLVRYPLSSHHTSQHKSDHILIRHPRLVIARSSNL